MTTLRSSSSWDQPKIDSFLDSCLIPIRLACLQESGKPIVCSLWYLYEDSALWCATQSSASVVRFLRHTPVCGFEVAPDSMPYRGVRGQGLAVLDDAAGEAILLRLIDRYLGERDSAFACWLVERAHTEVAIRIQPDWITSWDFSGRMSS